MMQGPTPYTSRRKALRLFFGVLFFLLGLGLLYSLFSYFSVVWQLPTEGEPYCPSLASASSYWAWLEALPLYAAYLLLPCSMGGAAFLLPAFLMVLGAKLLLPGRIDISSLWDLFFFGWGYAIVAGLVGNSSTTLDAFTEKYLVGRGAVVMVGFIRRWCGVWTLPLLVGSFFTFWLVRVVQRRRKKLAPANSAAGLLPNDEDVTLPYKLRRLGGSVYTPKEQVSNRWMTDEEHAQFVHTAAPETLGRGGNATLGREALESLFARARRVAEPATNGLEEGAKVEEDFQQAEKAGRDTFYLLQDQFRH